MPALLRGRDLQKNLKYRGLKRSRVHFEKLKGFLLDSGFGVQASPRPVTCGKEKKCVRRGQAKVRGHSSDMLKEERVEVRIAQYKGRTDFKSHRSALMDS